MERRQMTRYDFGAIAEVIDLDSREDVIVVTRDLSLGGCFVKTRTPLPAGSEVRVRITYAGRDFAATGFVTRDITREGMAIRFTEMGNGDRAIIEQWLDVAALRQGEPSQTTKVVYMKNRLRRTDSLPQAVTAETKLAKTSLTNHLLASARTFWRFRTEARR